MKTAFKWAVIFGLPALALMVLGVPAHALAGSLMHLTTPMIIGSTVGATTLNLVDWAKRVDPDGKIPRIAELLSQRNAILEDILWREGNLATGHRIVQRVGLPSVFFRLLNLGVPKSKSQTVQVDEQCAILEARSEVDTKLADLNGDTNAFRLSEATPFIESMGQTLAKTLFYGNSGTDPEQFTGLAIRYGLSTATNGQNIIKAPGSGSDQTSIWLVGWGEESVYGIFPKGSRAGLLHEDLGIQDAFDALNNRFRAYMERYVWDAGIAVKDWRYIVRIANVDISDLIADGAGSSVLLTTYMAKAIDRIPQPGMSSLVFYCNRTVASMLRVQAMNKSVAQLGFEKSINQFGQTIFQLTFLGIPVKICDQITNAETSIS